MNTLKSNLDATDWRILEELQVDARLSYAEIGRRVGLSSPAVQERVRRLEDAGIIEGYKAQVNPKKLGLPILSLTRLSNVEGKHTEVLAKIIADSPEVISCYHVMGIDEFHIQIVGASIEAIEDVLHRFKDYCSMTSSIVIKTSVNKRPITKSLAEEYDKR